MSGVPGWVVLLVAVTALALSVGTLVATLSLASAIGTRSTGYGNGMMGGGNGMMGGGTGMMGGGNGMMGGQGYGDGSSCQPGLMGGSGYGNGMMGACAQPGASPGAAGFAPGTEANPRLIRIVAGPDLAFHPASISVAQGETVTFVVTTMGPVVHEFMVGPADAVANDEEGTPEIDAIGMMESRTLTYTFSGVGPYAYACHVTGHYEAGMSGVISVVD